MRKTILTIILMCSMVFCQAQKKVWTEPATDYCTSYGDGYFNLAMDITKVELTKDETRVFIHISKRADINDSWFQFTKATYLRANGVRYPLVSADGIELDVHCKTDKDNQKDVVFHFKPLPLDTKEFDFIEGDGYGAYTNPVISLVITIVTIFGLLSYSLYIYFLLFSGAFLFFRKFEGLREGVSATHYTPTGG